jgi:hypothetical protein
MNVNNNLTKNVVGKMGKCYLREYLPILGEGIACNQDPAKP